MKEYTVREVLEFAQAVDHESYGLYSEAAIRLAQPGLMRICRELAEKEVEHFNRLRTMAQQEPMSEDELREFQPPGAPGEGPRIKIEPIPDDASASEILSIALRRERNTRATYEMMSSFTTISREVKEVFGLLAEEEIGHIEALERRLGDL